MRILESSYNGQSLIPFKKSERMKFWKNNKKNLRKRIEELIKEFQNKFRSQIRWWKIYYIISESNRLTHKNRRELSKGKEKIFGYKSSYVDLSSNTKKQGNSIIFIINEDPFSFLSKEGSAYLFAHEFKHILQVIQNPKKYSTWRFNDKFTESLESDADKWVLKNFPIFRREYIFENIVNTLDFFGFKKCKLAANWFYNDGKIKNGYLPLMTKQEYEDFMKNFREGKLPDEYFRK